MNRKSSFFACILIAFLSSLTRPSNAQIDGCYSDGVDCPGKGGNGMGICQNDLKSSGIGTVSFASNITLEGPLSWTLTQIDHFKSPPKYNERDFIFGMPPSLNISEITSFGGCSVVLRNISAALQPPAGVDFGNFTCGTVMGTTCAQDILSRVREELTDVLRNGTFDSFRTPCEAVAEKLHNQPFPNTCGTPFRTESFVSDTFQFQGPVALTGPHYFPADTQDGCDITAGSADYLLQLGSAEIIDEDEEDPDNFERSRTGTTPIFTFFYNEPWNNASTGPVEFLREPEVHMSCLSVVKDGARQSSGAFRQLEVGLSRWLWTLGLVLVAIAVS